MGNDEAGPNILVKFTNFVDRNLRLVRAVSWVLAGAGVIIILRRSYFFRWFKTVSDVPAEFITRNISLQGHVREVRKDNTLAVCHIPLLKGFRNSYHKFGSESQPHAESSCLLDVSVLGVEFREGSHKWLNNHVMSTKLNMTPVRITENNTLDCILYKKKGWFSSMCINEEMVQQGVAVTCHISALADNMLYNKLLERLLKTEVKAEKKGVGIWIKPSMSERLQFIVSSHGKRVKAMLSGMRDISIRKLFKKFTKDEGKK